MLNTSRKRKMLNGIDESDKDLNQDFLCPVCFEILEEAHVTKCGHTFCYKCITESLAKCNRCPQCNYSVEEFFPNFLLNEMVFKYKKVKLKEKSLIKINANCEKTDLQRVILEKYDNLNITEIDQVLNLLNMRKKSIEKEMLLQQNNLLKEFIERALTVKRNQFQVMQQEVNQVESDYVELVKMIEEEKDSKIDSEEAMDKSEADIADVVPCSSNNSSFSETENSTSIIQPIAESSKMDDTKDKCLTSIPIGEAILSQTAKQKVSAFNSIQMGMCEHMQAKQMCLELAGESSYNVRRKKMNLYFHDLQKCYFDQCKKDHFNSIDSATRLNEFKKTLNKFTIYSHLRPLASLAYVKETVEHNIVSSIEFDKDSEFFAIAGVAKKIKIFDYASVVRDSIGVSYPANEIECTSKISCLCWNPYLKSMMVTSDYEGHVVIWDAFLGKKLSLFQEHKKRCWSVDFNKIDVNLVASGSDDSKVKLWSANQDQSIATIESDANICSVKFNPKSLYHLAFASADHRVYYYDLRNLKRPLKEFKEHRKAVSYVNFLNEYELVSASTDSQIKLWNTNYSYCLRSYKGHVNEKNFVGLTANDDFIACGSENNSLYIYYKGIERSMLTYAFDKTDKEDNNDFVSAVCWRAASNVLVAANSQGNIKILELV